MTSEPPRSEATLPTWNGVLPPWPGELEDGVFVRRAAGRGTEPALFVHGLGGAATNWTDLMGLLADTVAGEAIDLPGFGHSDPPRSGSYRLRTHVDAVVHRLEQRSGPSHLFGNSLGGAVSTRVAALRPDLVRSLTLVSPAFPSLRPQRGSDPRLPLLLLPGVGRVASRQLARRGAEQRARDVLELCYGDSSLVPPERIDEAVEEVRRRAELPYAEQAFLGSLRGLVGSHLERSASLWRQAARVQAPTLVVWGELDRLVDVRLATRVARSFPDSRLLVLPGVGHVAQLECPEVVARAFLGMHEELAERTSTAVTR